MAISQANDTNVSNQRIRFLEDVKESLTRLTHNYPQRSVIYYGQNQHSNTTALNEIKIITDTFCIRTIWIRSTRSGTFSRDLLCSIQELTNSFYSDDNLQQHGQTILIPQSVTDAKDVLTFLTDIFLTIGSLSKRSGQGICIFIEDMQYLKKGEVKALTMAIHRSNQTRMPLMIFGAGLPSVIHLLGNACPYAERLFVYSEVSSKITEQS